LVSTAEVHGSLWRRAGDRSILEEPDPDVTSTAVVETFVSPVD
jgi:hypothetical protein